MKTHSPKLAGGGMGHKCIPFLWSLWALWSLGVHYSHQARVFTVLIVWYDPEYAEIRKSQSRWPRNCSDGTP